MTDVGDWITPTLTVDPFDGTTLASVVVVDPAGAEVDPGTAITSDGGATWSAPAYEATAPGEWVERWTVTGTGASVQRRIVLVAPDPTDVRPGSRVYASTADLARWLGTAPPAGARTALVAASRDVDQLLLTAVYDVDTAGLPTDPDVQDALRDATCAQAAYARALGDPAGVGAGRITQARIGSVQYSRGAVGGGGAGGNGGTSPGRYSPQAWQLLQQAGLVMREPWVC